MGCTMGLVSLSPDLPSGSLSSWSLSGALPSRPFFSPLLTLAGSLPLLFSIQLSLLHSLSPQICVEDSRLLLPPFRLFFFFFLISHRLRRGRVWVLEPKSGLEPSLCWTRFLTLGKSQSIYASDSLAINRDTWVQTSSLSVNMLYNLWNLRANNQCRTKSETQTTLINSCYCNYKDLYYHFSQVSEGVVNKCFFKFLN